MSRDGGAQKCPQHDLGLRLVCQCAAPERQPPRGLPCPRCEASGIRGGPRGACPIPWWVHRDESGAVTSLSWSPNMPTYFIPCSFCNGTGQVSLLDPLGDGRPRMAA